MLKTRYLPSFLLVLLSSLAPKDIIINRTLLKMLLAKTGDNQVSAWSPSTITRHPSCPRSTHQHLNYMRRDIGSIHHKEDLSIRSTSVLPLNSQRHQVPDGDDDGSDTYNEEDDSEASEENEDTLTSELTETTNKNGFKKGTIPPSLSLWDEIGGFKTSSSTTTITYDHEDDFPKFSKMKWKKKSFLMLQDVRKELTQNRKRAPQKAEEVVQRLQRWYEYEREQRQNMRMPGDSDTKSELDSEEQNDNSLLDYMESTVIQAYNLWISALAKSKLPGAGYMAEDVLIEMKTRGVPANVVTYTGILDAHARSGGGEDGGGARAAEDFLFRLLQSGAAEGNLNAVTVDTILNAWAQEGTLESAEHAEMILYRLEDKQQSNFRPTPNSYATGESSGNSLL
jgi:hypothetical protein